MMTFNTKLSKVKIFWLIIFILGLVYVLLPGPSGIEDFPPLPNSVRSQLDGDTWQNPNLKAYLSDFRRADITKFYKSNFDQKLLGFISIPSIRINHPPELAFTYVRDQQESTFLEEYVLPLRESVFVNGYEPLIENYIRHKKTDLLGASVVYKDVLYASKTTLRYYPTNPIFRVLVYLGIWSSFICLWKIFRKSQREY